MVEHVFGLLLVNRAGPHERGAKRRMKLLHASVLVTLGGIKRMAAVGCFSNPLSFKQN